MNDEVDDKREQLFCDDCRPAYFCLILTPQPDAIDANSRDPGRNCAVQLR